MTYELAIGDRLYSSWSLRGWLLFAGFDIPVSVHHALMYSQEFKALCNEFAPTKLVPAMRVDGEVVWDSFAMAEELASRHPLKNFWPKDINARAMARSLVGEMHSGFSALRNDCTMNLRHCFQGFEPSAKVVEECERAEELWSMARSRFGQSGPWLFGEFSVADVFYAPLATRLATYGLAKGETSKAYVETWLAEPNFRRWRAMGIAVNYVQPGYDLDLPTVPWGGPQRLNAIAVDGTDAENETCPYSGKEVTHCLELDGRRFGFCNAFCRDKTVADAAAWPQFMSLLNSV